MRLLEKLFKPHPRLLDFQNAIPLANILPKLFCPVNDRVRDVQILVLCVGSSSDVGELKNLFHGGKYGRGWVSRMVRGLLDNALALE